MLSKKLEGVKRFYESKKRIFLLTLGSQRIYTIKSFDREKKQYVYNVNANTGVSNLNGTPYQVQIGLRYAF